MRRDIPRLPGSAVEALSSPGSGLVRFPCGHTDAEAHLARPLRERDNSVWVGSAAGRARGCGRRGSGRWRSLPRRRRRRFPTSLLTHWRPFMTRQGCHCRISMKT